MHAPYCIARPDTGREHKDASESGKCFADRSGSISCPTPYIAVWHDPARIFPLLVCTPRGRSKPLGPCVSSRDTSPSQQPTGDPRPWNRYLFTCTRPPDGCRLMDSPSSNPRPGSAHEGEENRAMGRLPDVHWLPIGQSPWLWELAIRAGVDVNRHA